MGLFPQTVCLTLGVLTVMEKGRVRSEVADRIRGNSRSFVLAFSFCVAILVLFGSSTSSMSMCIFRGNSRTFGLAAVFGHGFCVVILIPFGASTSSMCLFVVGSSRT